MRAITQCLFPVSALAFAIALPAVAADEAPQRSVEARLSDLEQKNNVQPLLPKNIEFSGLVEVQGAAGEDVNDTSYSDISVATVELGMNAQINDRVSSEIIFLYEEGATDFGVDVATISIDKIAGPVDLTVGKMYVPFGHFETALINDTLVLSMAETRQTAVLFGMEQDGLKLGGYVFDGTQDRERHAENYGFTLNLDQGPFTSGIDYISSLTESDGVFSQPVPGTWDKSAPAVSMSGEWSSDNVSVITEYLTATSNMRLNPGDAGFQPKALQLEANVTAPVSKQAVTFAMAYQTTREAGGYLPRERVSLGCSSEIYKNVKLAGEYWHDKDYGAGAGGTGGNSDNLAVQLSVTF